MTAEILNFPMGNSIVLNKEGNIMTTNDLNLDAALQFECDCGCQYFEVLDIDGDIYGLCTDCESLTPFFIQDEQEEE